MALLNTIEKRIELEKLKKRVHDLILEIDCAEARCNHIWLEEQYTEEYNTGEMELDSMVMLSDGTSLPLMCNRYKTGTRTVWVRTCAKCGKREETRKQYPVSYAPVWRNQGLQRY